MAEVFRFVNVLRLNPNPDSQGKPNDDDTYLASLTSPAFLESLISAGPERESYEKISESFIQGENYAFNRKPLSVPISELQKWLLQQKTSTYSIDDINSAIKQIFGKTANVLVSSNEFKGTVQRLADSLLAVLISTRETIGDRRLLTRYIRLVTLIIRLSSLGEKITENEINSILIYLPDSIFPLPAIKDPNLVQQATDEKEKEKNRKKNEQNRQLLYDNMKRNVKALEEIQKAYSYDREDLRKSLDRTGNVKSTFKISRIGKFVDIKSSKPAYPIISKQRLSEMSEGTKLAIENVGVSQDFVDVMETVRRLEGEINHDSAMLFMGKHNNVVAKVGNQWVISDDLPNVADPDPDGKRYEPGMCTNIVPIPPAHTTPTVPSSKISEIKPIGVAELLQVKQRIDHYRLGEVAHIENVMLSEHRWRTHRVTSKLVETLREETEKNLKESLDLQTTERFELQEEASKIVNKDNALNVEVNFSATYGPVTESLNVDMSRSESKEQSDKSSTNYSKDVVDRAVKEIQSRVLEERISTRELEVEEINKHGFDNRVGSGHIQGIYRWVDKIYEAQIVSYGLRTMFEFILPEPAAFYRYVMKTRSPEGMTLEKPIPPGYCIMPDHTFVNLLPSDINETNYLFWVSKYNVSGVSPPPSRFKLLGIPIKGRPEQKSPAEQENKPWWASEEEPNVYLELSNVELTVPDGYLARHTWVSGGARVKKYDDDPHNELPDRGYVSFYIGRTGIPIGANNPMNGEEGVIPIAIFGFGVHSFAATVEVLSERSKELFATWQFDVYNAIINSYNEQKSNYEGQLARAQSLADNITSNPPDYNRTIEKMEIKKGCLAMVSGQHFDDFDAMIKLSNGWPQIDLEEARAEGKYIRFFEQAFEWENMNYRFYPYFWGRKSEWSNLLSSGDKDPLFSKFLQAGSVRVQIPVRPGFDIAVNNFLLGAKPWENDDDFRIDGSLYSSIIDEITEDLRGSFTRGKGTITVTKDSNLIQGVDTEFDKRLHTNREIYIQDSKYKIKEVISNSELILENPYLGENESNIPYSFGGKLIGDPWKVKIPTTLVFLQTNAELPSFDESI